MADPITAPAADTASRETRTGAIFIAVVALVAVGYSILRYGIVKGVPVEHWPAYVGNKAVAFAAVGYLLLALIAKVRNRTRAKLMFEATLICTLIHAFASAALLGHQHYGFLYTDAGKPNLGGELTIILGATAAAIMVRQMMSRNPTGARADLMLLVILIGHVMANGLLKWLDPNRWTMGMVPISLLSCTVLVVAVIVAGSRLTRSGSADAGGSANRS
jgi:hypothetical protein